MRTFCCLIFFGMGSLLCSAQQKPLTKEFLQTERSTNLSDVEEKSKQVFIGNNRGGVQKEYLSLDSAEEASDLPLQIIKVKTRKPNGKLKREAIRVEREVEKARRED